MEACCLQPPPACRILLPGPVWKGLSVSFDEDVSPLRRPVCPPPALFDFGAFGNPLVERRNLGAAVWERNRGSQFGEKKKAWRPRTKLGRLVGCGKIKSLEEIFLYSTPIEEEGIVDFFLGPRLRMEVLGTSPVSCSSGADRVNGSSLPVFRAIVAMGDFNGHVGLGIKTDPEMATAIRGAIAAAKLAVIPVRRGAWGACSPGVLNTLPQKVSGSHEHAAVHLIPSIAGTGVIAPQPVKQLLLMAGVNDCYAVLDCQHNDATTSMLVMAAFAALQKTYSVLRLSTNAAVPPRSATKCPYDEYTDFLLETSGDFLRWRR